MDGNATSPRLFWQARSFNSENTPIGERNGSPSPTRRSSIERLQKASRVKNSNILALEHKNEYDPTRVPQIERPLSKIQGNAFGGTGIEGLHNEEQQQQQRPLGHQRNNSKTTIPFFNSANTPKLPHPTTTASSYANLQMSPSREQPSPTKSALSPTKFKSSFDAETGEWSSSGDNDTSGDDKDLPEGKYQHRHAKSVTFDAAPPQVNEYEMATPDISTVGSDSREGSYESEDDEDYEDDPYYSHEHHGHEDSFDASLEDLEKTPVVGPDDWRQGSHDNLDGYENSPMPDDLPPLPRPQHSRTDSSTSNGDHRPLPPLPGMGMEMDMQRSASAISDGLSATAERMVGAQRDLPSPPPASSTKSEIQNIGNGKMSLEERLRLMMLSDDNGKSAAELQRERRMRRAGTKDRHSLTSEPEVQSPAQSPVQSPGPVESSPLKADEGGEAEDTLGDLSALDDYELPQRISRESILRRVNGNKSFEREGTADYLFSSPPPSSSPERPYASYDPDVPLPSTEDSLVDDESEEEGSVIINRDAAVEIYEEVSEYSDRSESEMSGRYHDDDVADTEDSGSRYSDEEPPEPDSLGDDEGATTPRATTPTAEPEQFVEVNQDDLQDALKDVEGDVATNVDSHALPKPEEPQPVPEPEHRLSKIPSQTQRPSTPPLSKPEYDGSGWGEPEEDSRYDKEPGSPDSVIHNPMEDVDFDAPQPIEAPEPVPSPAIPEQVATIKSASGSKLKTRPSATPSDIAAMREARRQVSITMPDVPAIPERHRNRLSHVENELPPLPSPFSASDDYMDRHPSFKKRSLTLDLDLGLSLENEFDRVVEQQKVAYDSSYVFPPVSFPSTVKGRTPSTTIARKASLKYPPASSHSATGPAPDVFANNANITSRKQRGYLMRQNTKLVAASDKETEDFRSSRSAGNSPVKGTRPQSWTVEPWNGRPRQRSIRSNRKPVPTGPVPPLPGQESNAAAVTTAASNALKPLTEEDLNAEMAGPESGERGRLFVKVMGVKDLDLPLPRSKFHRLACSCPTTVLTATGERTWFSLTLDNGVHCVTTAWLELARNAPIGQEFELVVPNDLEFQLTLNVKLDKPAPVKQKAIPLPVKAAKPKQMSTFSRVFASPKKRKEMELRQREEEERLQREANAAAQAAARQRQFNTIPTAYDLLSPLVAEDGSFARAYVSLKEHEARCFGRPYLVEVATFNEWASEEASFASSVKSKRGNNTGVVRRAPYKIGKLELQLLFVPRPKGATDEDMPKSMNSCIREMKAAEERLARQWEGHLSQQGGDCPVSIPRLSVFPPITVC
jgi:hypothetical protein